MRGRRSDITVISISKIKDPGVSSTLCTQDPFRFPSGFLFVALYSHHISCKLSSAALGEFPPVKNDDKSALIISSCYNFPLRHKY